MNIYRDAFEKLAKWRQVFAGWQLGTRLKGDPESEAVRDHREVTMFLRCEVNALTRILLEKGVISEPQLSRIMAEEAAALDAQYEKKFPGMKSTPYGIDYDLAVAAKTMAGWRP
jgi:hypothetical protein